MTPVTVLRAARYRSVSRSLFRILPGELHPKKYLIIVGPQKNFLLKPPTTWISLIGWCFGLNRFSHVALVLWQRKMIFHQLIYKVTHAWANMSTSLFCNFYTNVIVLSAETRRYNSLNNSNFPSLICNALLQLLPDWLL